MGMGSFIWDFGVLPTSVGTGTLAVCLLLRKPRRTSSTQAQLLWSGSELARIHLCTLTICSALRAQLQWTSRVGSRCYSFLQDRYMGLSAVQSSWAYCRGVHANQQHLRVLLAVQEAKWCLLAIGC